MIYSKAFPKGLPEAALATPIPLAAQGLHVRHMQRISALIEGRQEKELLLDVRSQMKQVENLADARATDMAKTGELGLIGNRSLAEQATQADGQRHEPGQTRDALQGSFLLKVNKTSSPTWQVKRPGTTKSLPHARSPFLSSVVDHSWRTPEV